MATSKLYNSKVEIDFEAGKHIYLVTDKENKLEKEKTESVTGVTGIVAKPFLMYWTVKVMHEYLLGKWIAGKSYDEIEIKTLLDEGKRAHTIRLTQAGDIGTLVHAWCEAFIKSQIAGEDKMPEMPKNEQAINGVNAFMDWVSANEVRFVLSEQKVYSRKHRFVGTLDFTARFGRSKALIMGDIKTSNFFDPLMFWQVSGYQIARQEEFKNEKYVKQVIVRCGKDGTLEVQESVDFKESAKAFLACLTVNRRLKIIKKDDKY